jgi:hypothetical protein
MFWYNYDSDVLSVCFWYWVDNCNKWNNNQAQECTTMLNDEIIPNSFKISLLVIMKVANPAAVVKLVIKVAVPTLVMTLCCSGFITVSAIFLLVLISKKIQFGIPITITKVGTSAVRTVISNEINQEVKSPHNTNHYD